ncbi:MAG TPA: hypothetical protein VHN82_04845 [Methanoregula sp.]|nr:hypothetical protein [Methanoregula sp.]
MQLPRGTFREIRKKVFLQDLLLELRETRFTGTCGLVSGPATGSFVFRDGACILARFRGETGDAGWKAMMQSAFEPVDVILASFDEAQVKLSLEFNPSCRLTGNGLITGTPLYQETPGRTENLHAPPTTVTPASAPVKPSRRRTIIITGPEPAIPSDRKIRDQAAPRNGEAPREKTTAARQSVPPPDGKNDELENDIDALDTMDLEHVTSRIRSDCKNLVKQLQLDHLLEHEKP